MLQAEKCCQCLLQFSLSKMPRKLPTCSHNICESCLKDIIDTKQEMIICAFCSCEIKKEEIQPFPLNLAILLSEESIASVEQEKNVALGQEDLTLLTDLGANQSGKKDEGEFQQLCKTHKVIMDIICISDKQKICPHCALFGNHKDHRFKRVEDFEKEINQKCKLFQEIQAQKKNLFNFDNGNILDQFRKKIGQKKTQLIREVKQTTQKFILALKKQEENVLIDVQSAFNNLQEYFKRNNNYLKYQRAKNKLDKWQKNCQQSIKNIQKISKIEQKISYYYESPLQIISEGYIYISQLAKYGQDSMKKLVDKMSDVRLLIDTEMIKLIGGCMKLTKLNLTPNNSGIKGIDDELSDINPFLDCSSSDIGALSQSVMMNNNNSIDADISNISNSCRFIGQDLLKTTRKIKNQFNSMKSIEKQKPKLNATVFPKKSTNNPPSRLIGKTSRVSEVNSIKSPNRNFKSPNIKDVLPQPQQKPYDLKEPQKIYAEFSKNTLTDFFDISECSLPNDKVVEYVHRAKKIHKIKGLKLCSNRLNTAGFQKMAQFLKGVCNINLANNEITQTIFDVIVKNRDKIDALRVLNLSHNPICFDKKSSVKLQEVKRLGIIVIL